MWGGGGGERCPWLSTVESCLRDVQNHTIEKEVGKIYEEMKNLSK